LFKKNAKNILPFPVQMTVLFFTGETCGGTRDIHWVAEPLWPTQQVCLKPQRIRRDETQMNK